MMFLVNAVACGIGVGIGQRVRKQDFWANFLGIGLALSVSSAFTLTPWTLVTLPVFSWALYQRRNLARKV